MRQTQLILGDFAFTVSTAEYDRLSRSLAWRWPSHAGLNRRPALQYQGPESATITLTGEIHVETSASPKPCKKRPTKAGRSPGSRAP